ncbi:protein-disulfide reductase DsbD [Vibrio gazogenes]|uniref:Thiol:disulfide interchange protein DsbD n=1 Tax=Vibrio gazogenes DSM 21264 = NBRC 103151 TaxID=1123492 RepID=A0A1M5D482_VIBGA|nr:protein-disulfide reductase DsbD [Vibrio gazogenes]USP13950.1 protein-disulfide reductase DsbD [Vibrio gazogenes]SHF61849.1 Thiol:disulfide interchange protein DsbD [Vibrio gazogenes DSM 21264] [Vibrio gazogenes DSM 21264 = NBRC 103151]SJN54964.1 Thiol:disulfide interchange protein DsbD precursor [Vibrio gazogenes]
MRSIFLILTVLASALLPLQAQQFDSPLSSAFTPNQSRFVTVDQAFPFLAYQQGNRLTLSWDIQPGYYLYQHKLNFDPQQVRIVSTHMRQGESHRDEFFGDVNIYTTPLQITLELADTGKNAEIQVGYQGCAAQGFCYPPEVRTVPIAPLPTATLDSKDSASNSVASQSGQQLQQQSVQPPQAEQNRLADALRENLWTVMLFLFLGIGLAFTPCVFPMYPIVTSIVLGQNNLNKKQAFGLAVIYVQGMALTYTLLGLAVASAGLQFQAALQSPTILITFSLLFILLSLSMFGLYTIQMPATLQTALNNLSQQQSGGRQFGVFIMGAISGLICSPCTTAPLSGALLYVAQTGDLMLGGIALYLLGLGMGIPLIMIAVFGQRFLPKSGPWMEKIKTLFGFILLAAPIFLLERIIPELWSASLWTLLGVSLFLWILMTSFRSAASQFRKTLLLVLSLAGVGLSLTPVALYSGILTSPENDESLSFVQVQNVDELAQQLALAKANQQPVMIDFYADWCVACKEFEKYTFSEHAVQQKLANYRLIQADITTNNAQNKALLNHLGVLGLPTLSFWNSTGTRIPQARITGFLDADDFLAHLHQYAL